MNRWARLAKRDDDDAFDANERVETRRRTTTRRQPSARADDRPTHRDLAPRRAARASPVPVPKKYQKKYQYINQKRTYDVYYNKNKEYVTYADSHVS